jgi:cobalamin biosynthesis protein CobD/CbiB
MIFLTTLLLDDFSIIAKIFIIPSKTTIHWQHIYREVIQVVNSLAKNDLSQTCDLLQSIGSWNTQPKLLPYIEDHPN